MRERDSSPVCVKTSSCILTVRFIQSFANLLRNEGRQRPQPRSRSMNSRILTSSAVGAVLASLAVAGFSGPPRVEVTDFGSTPRATQPVYDARLSPASTAPVKEFRIPIRDATVEIAKGVTYKSWTFGGTVPGPGIRVRECYLCRFRLVNGALMQHSIAFYAAIFPMSHAFRSV